VTKLRQKMKDGKGKQERLAKEAAKAKSDEDALKKEEEKLKAEE
jgi:hypothetical protein